MKDYIQINKYGRLYIEKEHPHVEHHRQWLMRCTLCDTTNKDNMWIISKNFKGKYICYDCLTHENSTRLPEDKIIVHEM